MPLKQSRSKNRGMRAQQRAWVVGQPTGGCKNLAGAYRERGGDFRERGGVPPWARFASPPARIARRPFGPTQGLHHRESGMRGWGGSQRTSQAGVKPHTGWRDAMRCDAGAWSRGAREALAQGRAPNTCYPVQTGQARPTHKTVQRGPARPDDTKACLGFAPALGFSARFGWRDRHGAAITATHAGAVKQRKKTCRRGSGGSRPLAAPRDAAITAQAPRHSTVSWVSTVRVRLRLLVTVVTAGMR